MKQTNESINEKKQIKISFKTAFFIIAIILIIFIILCKIFIRDVQQLTRIKTQLTSRLDSVFQSFIKKEEPIVYDELSSNNTNKSQNTDKHNYYQDYYEQNNSSGIFGKTGLNWVEVKDYNEYLTYFDKIKSVYSSINLQMLSENFDEEFFDRGKVAIIEYSAIVKDCLDIDFKRLMSGQTSTPELYVYYSEPIGNEGIQKCELHILASPNYMTIYEPKVIRETEENRKSRKYKEMLDGVVIAKPIIYLYPEETTNVSVKLGNPEKITCSYPKYTTGWNVQAKSNGDLIDLDTNKELYSLYYESESNYSFKVEKDGFVVKAENIAEFLEEKLSILGLTDREREEFIIYWLPKLEANNYNYIRFATADEINENMPLEITPKPQTLIRILMTFKGLENPIIVDEQVLTPVERKGFVAVEWGGAEIK